MPRITRKQAGLRPPTRITPLPGYPASKVVIHHGASATPTTPANAAASWRNYQALHMDSRGWTDIAYNFGVDPFGNVYVGRGPKRQGGATGGDLDRTSLSICAIGNYDTSETTPQLVDAIVRLIRNLVAKGHLKGPVQVTGHRDHSQTACPGRHLNDELDRIQRKANRPEAVPKPVATIGAASKPITLDLLGELAKEVRDLDRRLTTLEDR